MSIGLNMILNDVRPGNRCSLSYGFVLVAAVTEMKLQRKCICAEQCQAFPLPFVRALALFFSDVKQPKSLTQFKTGMDEKFLFNRKQKERGRRGREKSNISWVSC